VYTDSDYHRQVIAKKKAPGLQRRLDADKEEQAMMGKSWDDAQLIELKDRASTLALLRTCEADMYSSAASNPLRRIVADNQWSTRSIWMTKRVADEAWQRDKQRDPTEVCTSKAFEDAHVKAIGICSAANVTCTTYTIETSPLTPAEPCVKEIKAQAHQKDVPLFGASRGVSPTTLFTPFSQTRAFFRSRAITGAFSRKMPHMWFEAMPLDELPDSDVVLMTRVWLASRDLVLKQEKIRMSTLMYRATLVAVLQCQQLPLPTCLRSTMADEGKAQKRSTERSTIVTRYDSDAFLTRSGKSQLNLVKCVTPAAAGRGHTIDLVGFHIHKTRVRDHSIVYDDKLNHLLSKAEVFQPAENMGSVRVSWDTLATTWDSSWAESTAKLKKYVGANYNSEYSYTVRWSLAVNVPLAVSRYLDIRSRIIRWIESTTRLTRILLPTIMNYMWPHLDAHQLRMASMHGLGDSEPTVVLNTNL